MIKKCYASASVRYSCGIDPVPAPAHLLPCQTLLAEKSLLGKKSLTLLFS